MREDIAAVLERDPAARSWLEVVLLYSGLHALWWYAHLPLAVEARVAIRRAGLSQVGALDHAASRFIPERRSAGGFSSTMAWAWSSARLPKLGTT